MASASASSPIASLVPASVGLVLIRGLPGSGKSTLARRLAGEFGFVALEADRYFENAGAYRFDPARLADAHAWCIRVASGHLAAGDRVAIANTFVTVWELASYLGLAEAHAIAYRIVEARGAWNSIHAVPPDVIEQMRARWEAVPPHLEPVTRGWSR
jgi:predicted kinase